MTSEDILNWAIEAGAWKTDTGELIIEDMSLRDFANLVAKQQREEDAKLVESITLEWPDQPEFAQVERTTIQDCAKIIRQRVVTYD